MPSFEHEALVQLFRNRPALAAKLWALASGEPVPDFDEADVSDASLGELVPTERRADLVVMLRRRDGEPVLGIVVEVQLDDDPDKQYVWPLYAAALAARMRCTVALLVVCRDGTVAAWAQRVMEEQRTRPAALEIGPGKIPRLGELPDELRTPEMAVLAVKAHAHSPDGLAAAVEAIGLLAGIPADQAVLYFDMILSSLDAAARRALEALMQNGQYEYQSEFARRYYGQGFEEGEKRGIERGIEKGIERGIEKGRQEGDEATRRELAAKLLARGHEVTEVAELTGLPEEEVRQLGH